MPTGEPVFIPTILIIFGVFIFLSLLYMTISSFFEDEPRAAARAFLRSFLLPLPYFFLGLSTFRYGGYASVALIVFTSVLILALIIPTGSDRESEEKAQPGRFDERDIMFSRYELREGSKRFEQYYREHPDKRSSDDEFRKKPGLMAAEARYFEPFLFSAADAGFRTVEHHESFLDETPAKQKITLDPEKITTFVKNWARSIGAVSVGVTKLLDHHVYSFGGRGRNYGEPIVREHHYAIALTVEMNKYMLDRAPFGPIIMESAQQYLASGTIAVQIARFIRNLGYPARAHIDANYQVICPLVARDAGLGEIGRMGLLMTPQLGPRVRIAVVTTDLPLVTDEPGHDDSIIDFCTRCVKCAEVCPSRAIPSGDREVIDGVHRWRIIPEDCFTFWCTVGTDCGRCVSVCPYAHPDILLHNIVRRGVRNSSVFRRLAIWMDDFFYGRKPSPSDLPDWMKCR